MLGSTYLGFNIDEKFGTPIKNHPDRAILSQGMYYGGIYFPNP